MQIYLPIICMYLCRLYVSHELVKFVTLDQKHCSCFRCNRSQRMVSKCISNKQKAIHVSGPSPTYFLSFYHYSHSCNSFRLQMFLLIVMLSTLVVVIVFFICVEVISENV